MIECAVALWDDTKRLDTADFIEKLDSHNLTPEERSKRLREHYDAKDEVEPKVWPVNMESFEAFLSALTCWRVDGMTGQCYLCKADVAADLTWRGYTPDDKGRRIWNDIRIMEAASLKFFNESKPVKGK